MARKYVTDEELQKIIEDSDFEIDETLQSEDNVWESSSEEEDNVSMQEEHSDTEQTSLNSENSDGFQWDSLPPKSSKRRAHNIVTSKTGLQNESDEIMSIKDAFLLFISNDMIGEILLHTNRFCCETQESWNQEHPDKPRKNSNISKAELCAFIGILLAKFSFDSISSSCETPMILSNRATANVERTFNPKTKDSTNNLRATSDKKSNFTLNSPDNQLLEDNGVGTVKNSNRKFFAQIGAWKTLHSSTPVEKTCSEPLIPLNENSRVLQDEIATTFSIHSKPTTSSNTAPGNIERDFNDKNRDSTNNLRARSDKKVNSRLKSPTNELLEGDSFDVVQNSNRKFFAQIDAWKDLYSLTPIEKTCLEPPIHLNQNSRMLQDENTTTFSVHSKPTIMSNMAIGNIERDFNDKNRDSTNNLRARSDKRLNFRQKNPTNELLEDNSVNTWQNSNRKFFAQIDAWKTLHSTSTIISNTASGNVEGAFNSKTKDSTNNLRTRSNKRLNFKQKSPNLYKSVALENTLLDKSCQVLKDADTIFEETNNKVVNITDSQKTLIFLECSSNLNQDSKVSKNDIVDILENTDRKVLTPSGSREKTNLNENNNALKNDIVDIQENTNNKCIVLDTSVSSSDSICSEDFLCNLNQNSKIFEEEDISLSAATSKSLATVSDFQKVLTPSGPHEKTCSGLSTNLNENNKALKDNIVDVQENTNKECIVLDTSVLFSDSICSKDSLCNLDQNSKIFEEEDISLSAATSKSLANASISQKILTSSGALEKIFNNLNETNRTFKNNTYQKMENRKTKFTKIVPHSWKALNQNGLSKKSENIPSNILLCINKQQRPTVNIEQMAIDKCNNFLKKHNEIFMFKSYLQEINTNKQHINRVHRNQTDISKTMNELDFAKKNEFENSVKPHLTLQSHKAEMECEVGANKLAKETLLISTQNKENNLSTAIVAFKNQKLHNLNSITEVEKDNDPFESFQALASSASTPLFQGKKTQEEDINKIDEKVSNQIDVSKEFSGLGNLKKRNLRNGFEVVGMEKSVQNVTIKFKKNKIQCEGEESAHTEEVLSISTHSKGSTTLTKTIGFSKKRKLYNVSSEVFIDNEDKKIVKGINNCYNIDTIEQNIMQNTRKLSGAIKKQIPSVKTKTVYIEKYKKSAQFVYTLENLCQEIQINNTINKKLLLDKVINKKSKYYSNLQKERRKLNRRQNSGSEVIKILQNRLKMDEKEFGIIIKFMDRYKSLAEFNQTATEEILM
ncbi:hypothetical protein FQA39_LY06964 [Lamprigera yunnana]|nr:hypothetical protein FQA39_LY06964 [Lamprigera yunnana]